MAATLCRRHHVCSFVRRVVFGAFLLFFVALRGASSALAGGGPENAVLVVDPTNAESLYVANHYRAVRDIPESNLLYMEPSAESYQQFAAFNIDALVGTLAARDLSDHIDYVVIPPGGSFYVPTVALIDGAPCTPLTRLAISSAYGLAFTRDEILAGKRTFSEANRYFGRNDVPRAFDSGTSWLQGQPSVAADARRYLIGFMLGYTGERGNTIDEITAMIDRSAAVDGTHPEGTFYFMRTDDIRSTPRHRYFSPVAAAIRALGGHAEEIYKVGDQVALVPSSHHDVLGVMTGHADPPIDQADMTLLPGSFADHITSFAGMFDTGGQTKMSRWIAKGASGSMGTVEEPCVFGEGTTGKFPHPRLALWYYEGMSLGESLARSIQWAPYQSLYYGDPLARPFADFPAVEVPDAPAGPVMGVVHLTPSVQTSRPDTSVASLDLLIDGRRQATMHPGETFAVDTTVLADGDHDLRVVAYDDSDVRNQGRWVGHLVVANAGVSAAVSADPGAGDLSTAFAIEVAATGGNVSQIQLLQGARVIAATGKSSDTFAVSARVLGAGQARLRAAAAFSDGRTAVSAPLTLDIAYANQPGAIEVAPQAFDVTIDVIPGQPMLLSLPVLEPGGGPVAAQVVDGPQHGTVTSGAKTLLLYSDPGAIGTDTLTFRAVSGEAASEVAAATLRYCAAPWIVARPMSTAACPGRDVTLSVLAAGDRLSYQWYRNEVPIAGAIEQRLVVPSVTADRLGDYRVEVTGRCGMLARTVSSQSARLEMITEPGACGSTVYLPFAAGGRS